MSFIIIYINKCAYTLNIIMENNSNDNIINLKKKYGIKFKTNSLPIDFDKWIVLDKEEIDKRKYPNNYICLDHLKFVVIESYENILTTEIGGTTFHFKPGRYYLPILTGVHSFRVKFKENIKIYINPNNIKPIPVYDLFYYLLIFFTHIDYYGLEVIEKSEFSHPDSFLMFYSGMYGYGHKRTEQVDENIFYFDYNKYIENIPNAEIINDISNNLQNPINKYFSINVIDNYVQHDIIKICRFL